MQKIIKYGKKSSDILKIKGNLIAQNENLIGWQKKLFKIYKKEKIRNKCKNCDKLIGNKIFTKINIPYFLCKTCGHLNAGYKDTIKFAKKLYQDNDGKDYSVSYLPNKSVSYLPNKKDINDYKFRTKNIYLPKVDFLIKSLLKEKNFYNYMDIGCGTGHYISALKKRKINNFEGYDPSVTMVNFGNKVNNFSKLNFIDMKNLKKFIFKINSKKPVVISMIGTFEHIYNNIEILNCIKKNKKIKYLYLSVPCFSLSSFIELAFDNFYQRLMGPQHTHLYTKQSLKFMEKKYKLKIIAEWWFGVDILNLLRSLELNYLKKRKITDYGLKIYKKMFTNKIIDQLQSVLDKNKLSAEVHIIFKVNK
jgi:SAM-dependent methyltransferase